MARALPTKGDLIGQRFGRLEVIGRSDKRGSRGARTVPLWECRCDCGAITYKATDTLTNPDLSMCNECAGKYAAAKMRENAGFVDGTQISRIKTRSSIYLSVPVIPSLYFQCAAIPNSAVWCISKVRICISNGTPSRLITVV